MASSASKRKPACAMSCSMLGIKLADDTAPPALLCCHTREPRAVLASCASPRPTAMDIASVLVSKARRFMAARFFHQFTHKKCLKYPSIKRKQLYFL
jgi:hypothetical protein